MDKSKEIGLVFVQNLFPTLNFLFNYTANKISHKKLIFIDTHCDKESMLSWQLAQDFLNIAIERVNLPLPLPDGSPLAENRLRTPTSLEASSSLKFQYKQVTDRLSTKLLQASASGTNATAYIQLASYNQAVSRAINSRIKRVFVEHSVSDRGILSLSFSRRLKRALVPTIQRLRCGFAETYIICGRNTLLLPRSQDIETREVVRMRESLRNLEYSNWNLDLSQFRNSFNVLFLLTGQDIRTEVLEGIRTLFERAPWRSEAPSTTVIFLKPHPRSRDFEFSTAVDIITKEFATVKQTMADVRILPREAPVEFFAWMPWSVILGLPSAAFATLKLLNGTRNSKTCFQSKPFVSPLYVMVRDKEADYVFDSSVLARGLNMYLRPEIAKVAKWSVMDAGL